MSIGEFKEKIKEKGRIAKFNAEETLKKERVIVAVIIVFTGIASFGLGRLAEIQDSREPLTIVRNDIPPTSAAAVQSGQAGLSAATGTNARVFASKNGKKYYYPDCSGSGRVSEANKIWFDNAKDAESFGYTLASGCSE